MFVQLLGVEEHFLGETILPYVTPSPLATCSCFSERNVLIENATNAVLVPTLYLQRHRAVLPAIARSLFVFPTRPMRMLKRIRIKDSKCSFYRAMHYIEIACRPSVRLSVCLSVCNVGGSGSHQLEILETNNCTVN